MQNELNNYKMASNTGQKISETDKYWSARERRAWTWILFFGMTLLFMCRTVGPVTMSTLGKEFGWNKEIQVYLFIL